MHYKNGREAKVGDRVIGTTYNEKEIIVGTLISLTPGPDECSAQVGYTYLKKADENGKFTQGPSHDPIVRMQGTESHGTSGDMAVTYFKFDYTACKNLLRADDAFEFAVDYLNFEVKK